MRVSVIMVCLFFLVAIVFATPPYSTWGMRAAYEFALPQAIVFAYFGFDQLLNNTGYRPVWRSRLFWGTLLVSGILTLINYFQQDNLGSFGDGEFFRPTVLFYTSYCLNYALLTYLMIRILRLCLENLRHYIEFAYFVRRLICTLGIVILTVCCGLLMEANLILSIFFGTTYRGVLNPIYYTGWASALIVLTIGLATPQAIFKRLIAPLENLAVMRQQQREAQLSYLHARLMTITPHVELQNELLRPYRRTIEIGDARQVIWSHAESARQHVKARDEAEYIFDLLRNKIVLVEPADQIPPAPSRADITEYYVEVARHLQKLEKEI